MWRNTNADLYRLQPADRLYISRQVHEPALFPRASSPPLCGVAPFPRSVSSAPSRAASSAHVLAAVAVGRTFTQGQHLIRLHTELNCFLQIKTRRLSTDYIFQLGWRFSHILDNTDSLPPAVTISMATSERRGTADHLMSFWFNFAPKLQSLLSNFIHCNGWNWEDVLFKHHLSLHVRVLFCPQRLDSIEYSVANGNAEWHSPAVAIYQTLLGLTGGNMCDHTPCECSWWIINDLDPRHFLGVFHIFPHSLWAHFSHGNIKSMEGCNITHLRSNKSRKTHGINAKNLSCVISIGTYWHHLSYLHFCNLYELFSGCSHPAVCSWTDFYMCSRRCCTNDFYRI